KETHPNLQVVIPAAPTVAEMVKTGVAGWSHRAHVIEGDEGKLDAMKAATVALACSGTVTTELALAGVPMVIGYRLGPVTAWIVQNLLLRTRWVTLFNIAAQDFVAPELIQKFCTGPILAREVAKRLDDAELRSRQVLAQYAALDKMGRGGPDPSEAAADAVLKLVAERAG
ncbi:MAG: lipid-A-disaccharide synthase, partial [Phenylobacterium sp.]